MEEPVHILQETFGVVVTSLSRPFDSSHHCVQTIFIDCWIIAILHIIYYEWYCLVLFKHPNQHICNKLTKITFQNLQFFKTSSPSWFRRGSLSTIYIYIYTLLTVQIPQLTGPGVPVWQRLTRLREVVKLQGIVIDHPQQHIKRKVSVTGVMLWGKPPMESEDSCSSRQSMSKLSS
jgi:hypothetical protein